MAGVRSPRPEWRCSSLYQAKKVWGLVLIEAVFQHFEKEIVFAVDRLMAVGRAAGFVVLVGNHIRPICAYFSVLVAGMELLKKGAAPDEATEEE